MMARAFLFLALLLAALKPLAINAAPARWIHVQYRSYREVEVLCSVGYMCEVVLEPGEVVLNSLLPSAREWESSQAFDGTSVLTPHLILSPHHENLESNIILTTNRRVYRLAIRSVGDRRPTYVFFHYGLERALSQRAMPRPPTAPTPLNPSAVCVAQSLSTYRINGSGPWRPALACNDGNHTYLQLQSSQTTPTDLPVIFSHLDRERKDQIVNWTYDAQSRVYRIDGVFDHLVLAVGRERLDVLRGNNGK